MGKLDDFTIGYFEAAFFTDFSTDSENPELGITSINPVHFDQVLLECEQFQQNHKELLEKAYDKEGYTANSAGIDLWFTRNGHGVGYWDRGLKEVGVKLTEIAHQLKESTVEVGDDNVIYFTNLPKDRITKKPII